MACTHAKHNHSLAGDCKEEEYEELVSASQPSKLRTGCDKTHFFADHDGDADGTLELADLLHLECRAHINIRVAQVAAAGNSSVQGAMDPVSF